MSFLSGEEKEKINKKKLENNKKKHVILIKK